MPRTQVQDNRETVEDQTESFVRSPSESSSPGRVNPPASTQTRRNVSFAAALLYMICGGTLYVFSAYSTNYARKLHYTQTEINIVASAGGMGVYLPGPVVGMAVDRFGPKWIGFSASLLLLSGYMGMARIYSGAFFTTSYIASAFFYSLVGLGSAGVYNSAITSVIRNFPPRIHGLVIGLSVSLFGLSAFFFSQMSRLFQKNTPGGGAAIETYDFLIFLSLMTGGLSFIAGWGIQDLSTDVPRSVTRRRASDASLAAGVGTPGSESQDPFDTNSAIEEGPILPSGQTPAEVSLFRSPDAWMFFVAFLLLTGSGLMVINNVGTIVQTLAGEGLSEDDITRAQSTQVSIISIFNCGGRIVAGIASDAAHRRWGTRRLVAFIVSAAILLLAQIMGATLTSLSALSFCTAFVGFAYGSIFSSAPVIVGNWFGMKKFGNHWGWYQWGPAVGGQVLNTMFGTVIDRQRGDKSDCRGGDCFHRAFVWTGLGCAAALFISLSLFFRRRRRAGYTSI
ncbi:major facilitator superfamily domain-containing protein [Phlyctochytrium arcticum]|nr:major facilitator superfamily domain-containing protein [Phlyctochytrium arcticum]